MAVRKKKILKALNDGVCVLALVGTRANDSANFLSFQKHAGRIPIVVWKQDWRSSEGSYQEEEGKEYRVFSETGGLL